MPWWCLQPRLTPQVSEIISGGFKNSINSPAIALCRQGGRGPAGAARHSWSYRSEPRTEDWFTAADALSENTSNVAAENSADGLCELRSRRVRVVNRCVANRQLRRDELLSALKA